MTKNLVKAKNPRRREYAYRCNAGRTRKSGTFHAVSDAAALRYVNGLLKSKLPKGATVTYCAWTGKHESTKKK